MFLPQLIGQGEKCRSQMGRDETTRRLLASLCQGRHSDMISGSDRTGGGDWTSSGSTCEGDLRRVGVFSERWRIEEVGGYFDGSNTSDVYEFIDRLNSIASIKSPNLILKTIDTCFIKDGGSKEAYNWWIGKTNNDTRKTLQNHNTSSPLCSALKKRFGVPENQLLDQSTRMTYTPKDVSKSATGFVGQNTMLCHRIGGDTKQYTWVQSM